MTLPRPSASPAHLSSSPSAEGVASAALGFAAGITSTVLTGWVSLSSLGRAIVFFGSCLSGTAFAYWASRSKSPGRAFAKSAGFGALQANVSATVLVAMAVMVDRAMRLTPTGSPPMDLAGLAVAILIAGSIVGLGVGMIYGIVPALVAHWRRTRSIANADRAMLASAAFLASAAVVHASIVADWAAWAPLAVIASMHSFVGFIRMTLRARFLARVRTGREPRYRIEPTEGRSVLYRLAGGDDREHMYRENAGPPPAHEAIGVV